MRLLIEVEIPGEIEAHPVLEEIKWGIDTSVMGPTTLRLDDSGTIVNSRLGIYGNWKVVRP